MDAEALLSRAPRTDRQVFCRNPDDAKRLAELRLEEINAQKEAEKPRATGAKKAAFRRAAQAVEEYLASVPTITFHLRSVPLEVLEDLGAKHPPLPDQIEKYEEMREKANDEYAAAGKRERIGPLTYNSETYPPALIALLTEKVVVTGDGGGEITDLTAEVVAKMFARDAGWSASDQARLLVACNALSETSSGIPPSLVERLGNG